MQTQEFTEDMKKLAIEHRDQYIDFIVNNHRYVDKRLSIEDVKDDIEWIYKQCGQPTPKFIIFASSYMQEKLMINFIINGGLEAMVRTAADGGEGAVWTAATTLGRVLNKIRGGGGANDSNPISNNIWYDVAQELWSQVKKEKISSAKLLPISNKSMNSTLISREILATVAKELGARNVSPFMWSEIWDSNRTFLNDRIGNNVKTPLEQETRTRVTHMEVGEDIKKLEEDDGITEALLHFYKSRVINNAPPMFIEQNYGLLQDTWLSFYSYFKKIGMVNNERFDRYYSFLQKGIFSIQFFEDWCIITQLPRRITRDAQGRMHSIDGPAIEWWPPRQSSLPESIPPSPLPITRNYYIHGIPFEQKMWEDIITGNIPLRVVISLSNMEKRQAILSVIPPKKLIDECGGHVISTHIQGKVGKEYMSQEDYEKIRHREIKLYKIDDSDRLGMRADSVYILVYTDPSTDREYFMFVHPRDTADAATAMASTLGLTRKQYLNITAES